MNLWFRLNEDSQVDASKSRILIADLDPDIDRTLELYFQANGHKVKIIEDAYHIIRTARQWQPHAIILSTEFTEKNPYQICQELLEDTLTAHIPVIMLLHLADRRARLEALEAGADDTVTKPIDIEELRFRVEA